MDVPEAQDISNFLTQVRAIADPTRIDVVDALMVVGSATGTELGRMVPNAKSSMRWHLKQLEAGGFIEPVDRAAKPVVWRATEQKMRWTAEQAQDPQLQVEVQELERVLTDRRRRRIADWAEKSDGPAWAGTGWPEVYISRDYILHNVAPEDLEQLDEDLVSVVEAFRARLASQRSGSHDVTRGEAVFLTLGGFPWQPHK